MNGKIVVGVLLVSGLLAGAGMYWMQVYAFYERVDPEVADVQLEGLVSGMSEPVAHENYRGIDADSSPLRYRACFGIAVPLIELRERYVAYPAAVPLEGPGWFDCYDAGEIGAALETGEAVAFLGESNVVYGIDRVVAVFRDGRARSWHQINACGEAAFDGQSPPEGCPPPPIRTE